MSREQWGHGYWKGVKDAELGKVNAHFEEEAKAIICRMCIVNANKDSDRSLYSVRELISASRFAGVDEKYVKRIYDYVMDNEPYGAFITGNARAPWTDDYFSLPNGYNDTKRWMEEYERLTRAINDKEET